MRFLALTALLLSAASTAWTQDDGGTSPGIGGVPRLEPEPYYFATGFDFKEANNSYSNQVKFEVGVKYNAFGFNAGPIPVDLILQYHQVSFFHLYDIADSSPMYDQRFNFLSTIRLRFDSVVPYNIFTGIRLTPYHHESNGGNIVTSRSWDRAEIGLDFGSVEKSFFALSLFANVYIYELDPANLDIEDYLGRGGVTATLNVLKMLNFGDSQRWKLLSFGDATVRATWLYAVENLANIKLEVYYNPITSYYKYFERKNPNGIWTPSLYLQWYYGKGENLRDYRDVHNSVRVGLATVF